MDITIYIAIIVAIIFRVIIMKGNFVLPTFYRTGDNVSFNLGSITTVIVGVIAAIVLANAQPDLFANWYVAAITAYTAPQITDSIISAGTRVKYDSDIDRNTVEGIDTEDIADNISEDEKEGGV